MRQLTQSQSNYLIAGSSLLSTGGGGTITAAQDLMKKISRFPWLAKINTFKPNDLVITVVGVGDRDVCDPVIACNLALSNFEKQYRQKVSAIIPVEIGPLSLATALFLAGLKKLPVLDADIVGWRASPEVYLETVTLANLTREPLVIANDKGETLTINKNDSIEASERIMREFAVKSGGDAYAVGYPLLIKQIKNVVGNGSLSYSIRVGKDLDKLKNKTLSLAKFCQRNQLVKLAEGKIATSNLKSKGGFIRGEYGIINQKGQEFRVFVKNENIALVSDGKTLLTVPDSILLLNRDTYLGINNQDNNLGKSVVIFGKKAIPIWRTKNGLDLFNPRNLGYQFKQKLL